jgi:hypothetical protein
MNPPSMNRNSEGFLKQIVAVLGDLRPADDDLRVGQPLAQQMREVEAFLDLLLERHRQADDVGLLGHQRVEQTMLVDHRDRALDAPLDRADHHLVEVLEVRGGPEETGEQEVARAGRRRQRVAEDLGIIELPGIVQREPRRTAAHDVLARHADRLLDEPELHVLRGRSPLRGQHLHALLGQVVVGVQDVVVEQERDRFGVDVPDPHLVARALQLAGQDRKRVVRGVTEAVVRRVEEEKSHLCSLDSGCSSLMAPLHGPRGGPGR